MLTAPSGLAFITTDFLLKALKENMDHLVKSFTTILGALSQRVDANTVKVENNARAIDHHTSGISQQRSEIAILMQARVRSLEKAGLQQGTGQIPRSAVLKSSYILARRSLRLWHIVGANEDDIWEAVGDFIHGTLNLGECDITQRDIESIARVESAGLPERIRDAVIVTMYDKKARDTIISS